MKDFVRTTLAVVCGIFVMNIVGVIVFFMFVGSLAAAGDSKPVLPRSGVLKMDLSEVAIAEQAGTDVSVSALINGVAPQLGLWNVVHAIDLAAQDPTVQYIYLRTDGLSAELAQIEEIRKALENFRQGGKAIVAYIESPTTASYYLASVADKVLMSSNAGATPMITGVGSQMFFLSDLLQKLGVNVQLIRHGKFKSAGEMYIRNSPSPENLLQNQEMIDSIWESVAAEVAKSRGLSVESFSDMIEGLELNSADDMLRNSLVDELVDREGLKSRLASLAVAEKFEDVKMFSLSDYVSAKSLEVNKSKNKIAVVYADGEIVEGRGSDNVAGDRFAAMLAKIREDKTVKAVVLRVASPGGSVLAADKIKTEVDLLRAEKPVIASYGAYAASGGYWISASCDKIFTDNTTLTGSIGCFSMIPDFSKTAKDLLHVGVTTVGSSSHSAMYSALNPLKESEIDYMQKSIESIYSSFVSLVAQGREMSVEKVDSIAQGRVWTGSDAVLLGLADSQGTLEDALKFAAISASGEDSDLSSWSIESYPKPMTMMETLLSTVSQTVSPDKDILSGTAFESLGKAFKSWTWESSDHTFARMPYQVVLY